MSNQNVTQQASSVPTVVALTKPLTGSVRSTKKKQRACATDIPMNRSLKLLQANLYKSEEMQNALHNDEALESFTAILGQEPCNFMSRGRVVVRGTGKHRATAAGPQMAHQVMYVS